MGYSTTLYAVDIGALKAAFGSRDEALLDRVREVLRRKDGAAPRVDPTKGPRIRVNGKSEIYLNGTLVTVDEFLHALLDPKWEGTYLYTYQEGAPRGQNREGIFKEIGSFPIFFNTTVVAFFEKRGLNFAKRFNGQNCCNREQFAEIDGEEEDITEEQALAELIAGKITQKEHASTYGYALEIICEALGTRLDAVGTDQLKSLKLKTPLSRTRLPVKIPKGDDFPYISFLVAQEVLAEVERLSAMDLSVPNDREAERERRLFLELLRRAAAENRGVVGFYY